MYFSLFFALFTFLGSCSYDDKSLVGDPANFADTGDGLTLSASLSGVQDYIAETMPEYSSSILFDPRISKKQSMIKKSVLTGNPTDTSNLLISTGLSTVWSSTTASDLINPPGGAPASDCGETTVNFQTFMQNALDENFSRSSDESTDGNCDEPGGFKPTVFGRLAQALEVPELLVTEEVDIPQIDGKLVAGTYTRDVTVEGSTENITIEIQDVEGSDYYDTYMTVRAFQFEMYFKNEADELNILQIEDGEVKSFGVLAWDRVTGKLAFEYYYDSGDGNGSGTNMETFRLLIEETDGQVHMAAYNGSSIPSDNSYVTYAISAANGGSSTQVNVSMYHNYTDESFQLVTGQVCTQLNGGTLINSGACTGEESLDVSGGVIAAFVGLRATTDIEETFTSRGVRTAPAQMIPPFTTLDEMLVNY